jgi:hypothetical protein
MPLSALTSTTARYEKADYAKLVVVLTCNSHDLADLTTAGHLKTKLAPAIALLDGSVLIWYMTDWFSTAWCLYGARLKTEETRDPLRDGATDYGEGEWDAAPPGLLPFVHSGRKKKQKQVRKCGGRRESHPPRRPLVAGGGPPSPFTQHEAPLRERARAESRGAAQQANKNKGGLRLRARKLLLLFIFLQSTCMQQLNKSSQVASGSASGQSATTAQQL